ncbi:nickel-dependent hydrogenase large subunit [Patescibacteria group bacterium]|nr:nickel-dependent hydrogenase large subunit [Patescibacteria group bacterium]
MKTIQINHIAKTEGHLSFVGALIDGDFAQARIETEEGARLIEGILLGRKYYEAPIITSRICGICPIVHNLTAIKALEQALNVRATKEVLVLRKILLLGQWIHSHALHAFFLSFPDLVGINNNLNLLKKYPKQSELALQVRDWAVEICRIIGGRTVHPINSVIGGFNVEPDFTELEKLMEQREEILQKAIKIFDFISARRLPKFQRPTNYVSLKTKNEYAYYDGDMFFSDNDQTVKVETALREIEEIILPYERVKRVRHDGRAIMVGALARINNNFDGLNANAKKSWEKLGIILPCYNSFYNIFAQVVEIIHCVEEIESLYSEYQKMREKSGFDSRLKVNFEPNPGKGFAAMEAPRGILYHEYELDRAGNILHCNIISPTTIFISNLEQDLEQLIPQLKKLSDVKKKVVIKTLIRAYDPCISCATH